MSTSRQALPEEETTVTHLTWQEKISFCQHRSSLECEMPQRVCFSKSAKAFCAAMGWGGGTTVIQWAETKLPDVCSVGVSCTKKNCPMSCITFTASQDIHEGEPIYNYQEPRTYKSKVFFPTVLTYPELSKTVFCLR